MARVMNMDKEQLYIMTILIIVFGLFGFYQYFSGEEFFGSAVDLIVVLLGLFATLAIHTVYIGKNTINKEKERYRYLLYAVALWTAAEAIWAFYEIVLQIEVPFPSAADALWLLGYLPFFYFGYLSIMRIPFLYYLLLSHKSIPFYKKPWIQAVAVFLVAGAVATSLLKDSISASEAFLENLINLGYVTGDIILLSLSAPIILARAFMPVNKSWYLTGLALFSGALADIWFFQLAASEAYTPEHIVNVFFMIEYLLLGMAALFYVEEPQDKKKQPNKG
jgi:hypothetical protein